jgi:integrase
MSISKLANGQWRIDIRDTNDVRRVRLFSSEDNAKLFENTILKTLPPKGQRGRHKKPLKITLGEFITEVIKKEKLLLEKEEAKHGTIMRWESNLRLMPTKFTSKSLIRFSEADCEQYLAYLLSRPHFVNGGKGQQSVPQTGGQTLGRDTVKGKLGFLRAMLQRAVEKKQITHNPAVRLKAPKSKKTTLAIEDKDRLHGYELDKVLRDAATVLSPVMFALYSVLALSGLRAGEGRALQLRDLEFDHEEVIGNQPQRRPRIHVQRTETAGVLGCPKTWAKRYVDMGPTLERLLRWWVSFLPADPGTWLFRSPDLPLEETKLAKNMKKSADAQGIDLAVHGWCFTSDQIKSTWATLMRRTKLGRSMSPKGLRHTYATLSLEAGEDLFYVSKQLGHKTIKLTQDTYAKWANPLGQGRFKHAIEELHLPTQSLQPPVLDPQQDDSTGDAKRDLVVLPGNQPENDKDTK